MEIEKHPLEPFLPAKAKLLMLGSFPPQKKRWSMEFYYPNLNNDMWRIFGILFFDDKDYFLNETRKAFCRERIIDDISIDTPTPPFCCQIRSDNVCIILYNYKCNNICLAFFQLLVNI